MLIEGLYERERGYVFIKQRDWVSALVTLPATSDAAVWSALQGLISSGH